MRLSEIGVQVVSDAQNPEYREKGVQKRWNYPTVW